MLCSGFGHIKELVCYLPISHSRRTVPRLGSRELKTAPIWTWFSVISMRSTMDESSLAIDSLQTGDELDAPGRLSANGQSM